LPSAQPGLIANTLPQTGRPVAMRSLDARETGLGHRPSGTRDGPLCLLHPGLADHGKIVVL